MDTNELQKLMQARPATISEGVWVQLVCTALKADADMAIAKSLQSLGESIKTGASSIAYRMH